MPATIFKHCKVCGADYTLAQWELLPCIGYQGDGEGTWFELRNCNNGACLATLAGRSYDHNPSKKVEVSEKSV
jgi:hypothetical protein